MVYTTLSHHVNISLYVDRENQELRVAYGEISRTSIFAVVLSLDLDTCTITKDGSSFAPFGSQYHVKVTFEENTFGDDNAVLEFKVRHGSLIKSIVSLPLSSQKNLYIDGCHLEKNIYYFFIFMLF